MRLCGPDLIGEPLRATGPFLGGNHLEEILHHWLGNGRDVHGREVLSVAPTDNQKRKRGPQSCNLKELSSAKNPSKTRWGTWRARSLTLTPELSWSAGHHCWSISQVSNVMSIVSVYTFSLMTLQVYEVHELGVCVCVFFKQTFSSFSS